MAPKLATLHCRLQHPRRDLHTCVSYNSSHSFSFSLYRFHNSSSTTTRRTAVGFAYSDTNPLPPPTVKIDSYRAAAARIIGAALTSDRAYSRLAHLTDHIGNRISGSKNLERAIEWAVAEMKRDGLDNVRAEKVMVPHWVRGEESLEMLTPVPRNLQVLGLGNSVGTPAEGITAEAIVVRNFAELDRLGEKVRGKIVVYNVPFTSYGATVAYRLQGASRAARYGAVAALVRSITPVSLQTLHTGAMNYDANQPKIPVAAITIEVAEFLQRMNDRGDRPTLRLKMEAKFLPDAESANVIAEIKGSEKPDEVIVIGGHFDSWDVGQGAHDDGGGCIVAWETIRLLKELGLRPRRTIRVVLYTNEENGLRGGNAYRDAHRAELAKHILAIESDSGVYQTGRIRACCNGAVASALQHAGDCKTLIGNRRRSDCGDWWWSGHWSNHA